MMSKVRVLAIAAVAACVASTAAASPIISGDGESWTSTLAAVCSQVGGGTPCGGTTVGVTAHPQWMDDSLMQAQWVSYADTGYGGGVLAPRAGSAANPTGQTSIMEITESFVGAVGGAVSVRFWADDTLAVYYNNVLMKGPVFTQSTCADMPIGCETNEYWDLNAVSTGGVDTIRMVAFQVGTGTDSSSNPFGVLYSGSYQEGRRTVPEPMTLTMMGLGLAGFGLGRSRRTR
jgi:hypothetical protein